MLFQWYLWTLEKTFELMSSIESSDRKKQRRANKYEKQSADCGTLLHQLSPLQTIPIITIPNVVTINLCSNFNDLL